MLGQKEYTLYDFTHKIPKKAQSIPGRGSQCSGCLGKQQGAL